MEERVKSKIPNEKCLSANNDTNCSDMDVKQSSSYQLCATVIKFFLVYACLKTELKC